MQKPVISQLTTALINPMRGPLYYRHHSAFFARAPRTSLARSRSDSFHARFEACPF